MKKRIIQYQHYVKVQAYLDLHTTNGLKEKKDALDYQLEKLLELVESGKWKV